MATDPVMLMLDPSLVQDVINDSGGYAVGQVCGELGIQPAVYARCTNQTTESVAKAFKAGFVRLRNERARAVALQLIEIRALMKNMGYGDFVKRWMVSPLIEYDGRTPIDMLAEGRGQELISRLVAAADGSMGE